MATASLNEFKELFAEGTGFGDPQERENAELRLQIALAEQNSRTARNLNGLTAMLVVVGVLQVVILAFQVWGK